MQLRQVSIHNFRGIKAFDWKPAAAVSCLIGPGDSTKTTILDAIEAALSPRWSVGITDSDFYRGTVEESISITVTIGELPPALLTDEKFGLELRGWDPITGLRDEPEGTDEAVLTIRLTVDSSLEPTWHVINERRPEGRMISARDRETLGLLRLGGEIDRHLSWTRGSLLSRQTDSLLEVPRVLADAHRRARQVVGTAELAKLQAVARLVEQRAAELGVKAPGSFRPALEAMLTLGGIGPLSLHAGEIPVRALGLGSRRLVALALQWMAVTEGAIVLVDEVEHALEPHRLRQLLRDLRSAPRGGKGQVILTTHSSVAVEEMDAEELVSIRSASGQTIARRLTSELQDVARSSPEALLARNILVCEGKTEMGLCRGLIPFWAQANQNVPLAHTGTAFALGGGSQSATRAQRLAALGYRTALFADSDKPLVPSAPELQEAGVTVIQWPGAVSTEERVALDLPWAQLQLFLDLILELSGGDSAFDAVKKALPTGSPPVEGRDLDAWRTVGISESVIRKALGQAAKQTRVFKQIEPGQHLAGLISQVLLDIPDTDLSKTLGTVAAWCYGS